MIATGETRWGTTVTSSTMKTSLNDRMIWDDLGGDLKVICFFLVSWLIRFVSSCRFVTAKKFNAALTFTIRSRFLRQRASKRSSGVAILHIVFLQLCQNMLAISKLSQRLQKKTTDKYVQWRHQSCCTCTWGRILCIKIFRCCGSATSIIFWTT